MPSKNQFGVICINRGIFAGKQAWLKENGQIKLFNTEEEAAKEAERVSEFMGPFNQYFPKEYVG